MSILVLEWTRLSRALITGISGGMTSTCQTRSLSGKRLSRKERGAGALDNITFHQCSRDSLNIDQWDVSIDFVLIMMMLHEVLDADRLIQEVHRALAPNGRMLFSEPIMHVGKGKFQDSVSMIQRAGFSFCESPKIHLCRSAVFKKETAKASGD